MPQRALMQAAEWWGTAKTQLPLPRARHRASLERRAERARHDQPRARVRPDRQAEERLRHHRRPGQRPGRSRARAEVRSAPRLARHQQSRAPALHRRRLGHRRAGAAGPRRRRLRAVPQDRRGEIKGLLSICFNPKVSLPDNAFVTRCLEKLEFYAAIDFFLNDTAWHADIVLPGSLHEEDEGTVTQVEGRIIKINKAVDCPGEAREDWRIIQDIAQALGRPHGFTFSEPREIFEELRVASKGGVADYSGVTYEKIDAAARRLLAVLQRGSADRRADRRSSRHAAAVRARQLQPGREGQRAVLLPRRPRALQRRRLPRRRSTMRARSIRSS